MSAITLDEALRRLAGARALLVETPHQTYVCFGSLDPDDESFLEVSVDGETDPILFRADDNAGVEAVGAALQLRDTQGTYCSITPLVAAEVPEQPAHNHGPGIYTVDVTRTVNPTICLTVAAESSEEAVERALEKAGDEDFSSVKGDTPEYSAEVSDFDIAEECSLCGELCKFSTAHLHQGKWIGEECWDERLRTTE